MFRKLGVILQLKKDSLHVSYKFERLHSIYLLHGYLMRNTRQLEQYSTNTSKLMLVY